MNALLTGNFSCAERPPDKTDKQVNNTRVFTVFFISSWIVGLVFGINIIKFSVYYILLIEILSLTLHKTTDYEN